MGLSKEQEVTVVPEAKPKKRIGKKLIFISFIVIIGLLLFFAFFDNPTTGNVIGFGEVNVSENFKINAEIGKLNSPIETKQQIKEIYIESVGVGNKMIIGKGNILDLSELGIAKIKLEDFEGRISFDGEKIYTLRGEVSKITVNNQPTTSSDGSVDIDLERELSYRYLELNDFYLEEYESLKESGKIRFEGSKITVELEDDPFFIKDFFGILKSGTKSGPSSGSGSLIRNDGIILEGSSSNVEIPSESLQVNLFK